MSSRLAPMFLESDGGHADFSSPPSPRVACGSGARTKNTKTRKRSSSLPTETVDYLKAWMMSPEHIAHPYPTEQEKAQIMADTGIELKQLTNWFVNNRKRFWKPRVEGRLHQQNNKTRAASQPKPVVSTRGHVNTPQGSVSADSSVVTLDMTQSAGTGVAEATLMGPEASTPIANGGGLPHTISDASLNTACDNDTQSADDSSCKDQLEEYTPLQSWAGSSFSGATVTPERRRKLEEEEDVSPTPRKKFRRKSVEIWKEACKEANDANDAALPSLEEATQLFGFTTSSLDC